MTIIYEQSDNLVCSTHSCLIVTGASEAEILEATNYEENRLGNVSFGGKRRKRSGKAFSFITAPSIIRRLGFSSRSDWARGEEFGKPAHWFEGRYENALLYCCAPHLDKPHMSCIKGGQHFDNSLEHAKLKVSAIIEILGRGEDIYLHTSKNPMRVLDDK